MADDAGNLSIDFLAGFTIFMITFIYVATLIPGLFIGLQSSSIDYDAVAYRTGVVLTEDPGMPYNPSWESPSVADSQILRFGLALSKDTPNILSYEKINRFFCTTEFVYPQDYQSRAVFGDYPYLFNISLQMAGSNVTQSVGDVLPEDYGYSRRVIKVKEHSNATLDFSNCNLLSCPSPLAQYALTGSQAGNATIQAFSLYFNYADLLDNGPANNNPAYQINPLSPSGTGQITGGEGVLVNLTGLGSLPQDNNTRVNLSSISVYRSVSLAPLGTGQSPFEGPVLNATNPSQFELFIDGTPVTTLPQPVTNNATLFIPPGLLSFLGQGDSSTLLNVTMQFSLTNVTTGNPQPDRYLNTTQVAPYGAFQYNYTNPNITQPYLQNGVMEVAVW
ncbi:hypothetical protein Mboo_0132 [Methanoregula boonei 6A8]|jgi:hypothetical protein|uniref:Uncharacterized protein n=1 Tax=Methanoregula boonei (strain DSM 21154 / JCM 14090 / 6A8) TaxID=456442 RepID=A7I4J5_METB6|nr:hypothetical protein [Methanoregula boonei]ABS54656.1 hypothetical protein Mboo_0132 [Methanoregula boonei 6A8]